MKPMKLSRRHLLLLAGMIPARAMFGQAADAGPKLCMGMNWFQISEERMASMRRLGVRWVFLWGRVRPRIHRRGVLSPARATHRRHKVPGRKLMFVRSSSPSRKLASESAQ